MSETKLIKAPPDLTRCTTKPELKLHLPRLKWICILFLKCSVLHFLNGRWWFSSAWSAPETRVLSPTLTLLLHSGRFLWKINLKLWQFEFLLEMHFYAKKLWKIQGLFLNSERTLSRFKLKLYPLCNLKSTVLKYLSLNFWSKIRCESLGCSLVTVKIERCTSPDFSTIS